MTPSYNHRALPPDVASSIRRAVEVSGLSYRRAAQRIGIDPGYLAHLASGRRVPSIAVARSLIEHLPLGSHEAARLQAVALPGVGKDRHS